MEALAFAFSRLKSPELGKYFNQNVNQPNVIDECVESALSDKQDQRLVLFIDQFEEIFTQVNKEITATFIQLITNAVTKQNGRVIILFCMRSDFIPNCATYPELNTLLNKQFIQIGAMQAEELVSAIAQPALRVGLRIDPDLIAQIINDMKGEPGALPLMQFALKDLFDDGQNKGGVIALTLDAYLGHGGIQKSLERHADAAFGKLEKHEQELARNIFSGLIEIGRGTQDTRRTALFQELIPANTNESEVETIVQKLADARLVTTDQLAGKDTITISHEKLIDAWPWLKKLVNENREVIALQNEINNDAKEWGEHKRDVSYLYTGARLLNADEQVKKQNLNLNQLAREFVKASQTRKRRSQGLIFSGISFVLIVSIIASVLFRNQAIAAQVANNEAIAQREIAEANAEIALARQLMAESTSNINNDLDLSLLLSVEAYNLQDTFETKNGLLSILQQNQYLKTFLPRVTQGIFNIALAGDEKTLLIGEADNTIRLLDISSLDTSLGSNSRKILEEVHHFAFSPLRKILITTNKEQIITVWDFSQQFAPMVINSNLWETNGSIKNLGVSSNGKILAIGISDGYDSKIILLDISDLNIPTLIGAPLVVLGNYSSMALNPNGNIFAIGNADGTLSLYEVANIGLPTIIVDSFSSSQKKEGYAIAFSTDGKVLASSAIDNTITLWDISNPVNPNPLASPLYGNNSTITGLIFNPDNTSLISAYSDGTSILWDIRNIENSKINEPFLSGSNEKLSEVAISSDGEILITGSVTGEVRKWDITDLSSPKQIFSESQFSGNKIIEIKVNATGDSATFRSADGRIGYLGESVANPYAQIFSISPDGRFLAYVNRSGTISVCYFPEIDYCSLQLKTRGDLLTFGPNNNLLVSNTESGNSEIWDVSEAANTSTPLGVISEENTSIATFSPNSQIAIIGNNDGTITLWDINKPEKPKFISQITFSHNSSISALAISDDGKTLASGATNGTVVLWDITNLTQPIPIVNPQKIDNNSISTLAFRQNDKTLIGANTTAIFFWNYDIASWVTYACQRAGRILTESEWGQFFGNSRPYNPSCNNLEQETILRNIPIKILPLIETELEGLIISPISINSCTSWILFESTRNDDINIFRIDNTQGTSMANIFNLSNSPSNNTNPDRSPDNKWIVFQSDRNENTELYLSDSKGIIQKRLTETTSNNTNAVFAPDGTSILYQSDRNGNLDIFLINTNTQEETQLTSDSSDDTNPSWSSSNNKWITFQSNKNGNWDVYILDTETGNEYQITDKASDEVFPLWSSDDKFLSFLSNDNQVWNLYIYSLSDQTLKQVNNSGDVSNVTWSPDGDRIAYQMTVDNNTDIFVYNLKNDTTINITDWPGPDIMPSWDCSGEFVSFTSFRNGNANIFFIPWEGGVATNITTSYLDESNPVWSP